MLFLQLPPVHSPSTARPPDPDIRSRSSVSSLLPCYFCSSRPSTARPPPVHRIRTFALAPPALASSTARPPDPDIRSRSSVSSLLPCYFCSSRPSTARPPPVHRIRTFALAPPSLASSHAISAAPARGRWTGCGRAGAAEIAWEEARDGGARANVRIRWTGCGGG